MATVASLKLKWVTGYQPDEDDYDELFDSFLNISDNPQVDHFDAAPTALIAGDLTKLKSDANYDANGVYNGAALSANLSGWYIFAFSDIDFSVIFDGTNYVMHRRLQGDIYTNAEVDALLATKAAASHSHDDQYYTESEVDTALAGKAAASHSHDDLYYTESEVDTALNGKSDTDHTHANLHAPAVLGTKTIDETDFGAHKFVKAKAAGDALEYADAIDLSTFQALSDGATVTLNAATSPRAKVTLGGNRTLAVSNAIAGMEVIIACTQGSGGGHSFNAFPAGSLLKGGALAFSPDAGDVDVITGLYDGTNWYWNIGDYS